MVINWINVYKKYKGLWVALKSDEITVISSGKSAKEAWDKAKTKGYFKPILTKMPERLTSYVGFGH